MEISIGMTRHAFRKVAEDLIRKIDNGVAVNVSLYGVNNDRLSQEIIVTLSDDDMYNKLDSEILVELTDG